MEYLVNKCQISKLKKKEKYDAIIYESKLLHFRSIKSFKYLSVVAVLPSTIFMEEISKPKLVFYYYGGYYYHLYCY